jgi:hypothetical protein
MVPEVAWKEETMVRHFEMTRGIWRLNSFLHMLGISLGGHDITLLGFNFM